MNYSQAISFLNSLGNEITTAKLGLENMRTLLNFLGHPQKEFPCVLIAGTNGKGSVAAFTESIMRKAGYRTGLYTSPHLVKVEERIKVHGEQITQSDFARLTKKVRHAIGALLFNTTNEIKKLQRHPTHFEILTAIALLYFAERQVEIAVVEVGLGGRLDATNIIDPVLAVITSISFDHQAYLGKDLESITREKIGIIKRILPSQHSYSSCLPVVCSSTNKTVINLVKQQCKSNQAQFISAFQDLNFKILNNSLEKTNQYSPYKAILQSRVAVGNGSTMLREKLSVGEKILSCNLTPTNIFNFPIEGICSIKNCSFQQFEKRLLKIYSMSKKNYFSKMKKSNCYTAAYDKKNPTIKKIKKKIDYFFADKDLVKN